MFFMNVKKESKIKNVKFSDSNIIIPVDKLNYIDIVGDIRDPNDNPNYCIIAQCRTFRLNSFSLKCPLISWNSYGWVFNKWKNLIYD